MARCCRYNDDAHTVFTVRGTNSGSRLSRDDLVEHTVTSLEHHGVFVDSRRAAFVRVVLNTLDRLQRGGCRGRGNCFILSGVRDTGKSTTLRNLLHSAALHLPRPVVLCYVNLKSGGDPESFSPVDHITSELSRLCAAEEAPPAYDASHHDPAGVLNKWLLKAHLAVMLVVDECRPTWRLALF